MSAATGFRKPQRHQYTQPVVRVPYKALPLVRIWDGDYEITCHTDFDKHRGDAAICDTNDLTWTDRHTERHGTHMGEPYPPRVPIAGATIESKGTVKVMMYHGLTNAHHGLCDPAVMPAYVTQVAKAHGQFMTWARLDPELPSWDDVRFALQGVKWDVGHERQAAYARPDGTERTLAYNSDTCKWEPKPNPDKGQAQKEKQTIKSENNNLA